MALVLMAACGDEEGSRIPEASELRGTYDLVAASRGEPPVTGVGSIALGDDEVFIQLSHPPVAMEGTVTLQDGFEVAGFTAHSDVRQPVTATGTAVTVDGMVRIRLVVSGLAERGTTEVVMERPVGADLSDAAGRFRLDFPARSGSPCLGSIEIETLIERGGSAAVISRDDRSGTVGRLGSASIDVAPSGRFALDAAYVAPEGACPVGPIHGPPFLLLIEGSWPFGSIGATTARYELRSGLRFGIEAGDVTISRLE